MREFFPDSRRFVRLSVALVLLFGAVGMTQAANYWFESYERAVELIHESRTEEAQPLLLGVIEDHPVPQAAVRVPGNRFITYVPYLQRARIQFQQKEYLLASRSLDVSEAFGAVAHNRRHMTVLEQLRQQLRAKLIRGDFALGQPAAMTVTRTSTD